MTSIEGSPVYCRRILNNKLLHRIETDFECFHPNKKAPTKNEISETLSKRFKKNIDSIKIMDCKAIFGGGRTKGVALIYDTLENRKRFETMKYFRRRTKSKLKEEVKILKVSWH